MLDCNGPNVPQSYFNISFYSKMYESIHFIKLYTITHMRKEVCLLGKRNNKAYRDLQKYIIIFLK